MTVSEQIIEVLDALCEKFGVAIDWTQDNIFPYIEKLLGKFITWEISTSIFWIGFMLLITLILFAATRKIHNRYRKEREAHSYYEEEWRIGTVCAWTIFGGAALVSAIVIGIQIYDIITCCIFPEMVIFEKVQSLMPSGS